MKINEIIETINRAFAMLMTAEDLTDFELVKMQEVQILLNRRKRKKEQIKAEGTE